MSLVKALTSIRDFPIYKTALDLNPVEITVPGVKMSPFFICTQFSFNWISTFPTTEFTMATSLDKEPYRCTEAHIYHI